VIHCKGGTVKVKIFVAYSHYDKKYLRDDSLLGHLRGLEQNGTAEFWYDERITTGNLWDNAIRANIAASHIALLFVSEMFLTSPYIANTEIPLFLGNRRDEGMVIFPVILSPCDWQMHDWLKATRFLPKEGKNIEKDYAQSGQRKKLFLEVKRDLGSQIIRILEESGSTAVPTPSAAATDSKLASDAKSTEREWENPFDLVTANDLGHEDIPQLFVGEYTPFNKIKKRFDTILEGQRGTGKTMLLRYMAFETQIKIWIEQKREAALDFFLKSRTNFVGIYCRLEQGVFDRSDLDAVENAERRERLFEHRLSLFLLSFILKTLGSLFQFLPVTAQTLREVKQRLSVLLTEPQINSCANWNEIYNYAQQTIDLRVAEEDLHLSSLLPGGTPVSFNPWLTMSSQILPFLEFLQTLLAFSCPFFLLLDDFDVLRPPQQLSVFRTASARKLSVACFKYGVMTLGKKAILSGTDRTYREGHDYDHVDLDWTDNGLQMDYRKAVELITRKRLEAKSWPTGISFDSMLARWKRGGEIRKIVKASMQAEWNGLPTTKRPKTFDNYWSKYGNAKYFQYIAKKKIHHRYAGYETIIDISSGIYRQYLEICNQVVSKALSSGWRPGLRKPIGSEPQDEAIRSYSRAMMDSLSVTAGDATALLSGKISVTSKHMVTLVESLSKLFKGRLHSNIREPEIFCVSIKDSLEENPMAKALLEVAVRESVLHRRSEDYTPKTAGGPSLPTYMLNRRLAPRWGLSVRMQGRIEVSSSDIVLAAEDTASFVRKFLKDDRDAKGPTLFEQR
jgi:hypothetical protein